MRFTTGLSVGLGRCEPCGAPGAHWYPPLIPELKGVWMCDSCVHPEIVQDRMRRERWLYQYEWVGSFPHPVTGEEVPAHWEEKR